MAVKKRSKPQRKMQRAQRTNVRRQGRVDYPFEEIAITAGIGLLIAYGGAYFNLWSLPYSRVKWRPKDITLIYNPYSDTYTPADLVKFSAQLYECMSGITAFDVCSTLWRILGQDLSLNDLRGLHNAWHDNIDNKISLFKWIEAESSMSSAEAAYRQLALQKLTQAGVGPKIKLLPPRGV